MVDHLKNDLSQMYSVFVQSKYQALILRPKNSLYFIWASIIPEKNGINFFAFLKIKWLKVNKKIEPRLVSRAAQN